MNEDKIIIKVPVGFKRKLNLIIKDIIDYFISLNVKDKHNSNYHNQICDYAKNLTSLLKNYDVRISYDLKLNKKLGVYVPIFNITKYSNIAFDGNSFKYSSSNLPVVFKEVNLG